MHFNPGKITQPIQACSFSPVLYVTFLLLSGIPCGCKTIQVREPLPSGWSENTPHAHSEFWYELARRPVVCNDEVFHALLLYLDGNDASADFAARVKRLQSRDMLPQAFSGRASDVADRGWLAVALVKVLKIDGGLTLRLFGPNPRYALRALQYRGICPDSSPNQALSGAQFVGILQKAEEFERGSPADVPAAVMPSEIQNPVTPLALAVPSGSESSIALELHLPGSPQIVTPFFLMADDPLAEPATPVATASPRKLIVIITRVEGDSVEVRKSENDPWVRAAPNMVLQESAQFRTGAKSAVQFRILPNQLFCLDSQGTNTILEAIAAGRKIKTDVGLERGRLRTDLNRTTADASAPDRIEQAGIEHEATIRSPNSALVLRGTEVSLFEQPGFEPQAVSLRGVATYINTHGQSVSFGGRQHAAIHGSQTSAAQQAADRESALQSSNLARNDFETRETSIVIQRGGFVAGDVVVGNLHLSDFPHLPGALDFVLQWSGGSHQALNDLNLAVLSPLYSSNSRDFVANPPFIVSLSPNSAQSQATRTSQYPKTSPDGGQISKNSVGPDGLELASWPAKYPVGTYRVVVFNFLDAKPPPTTITHPVNYTIDVFLNGKKLIQTYSGSVGFLQTSPALLVPVPSSSTTSAERISPSAHSATATASLHEPARPAAQIPQHPGVR